MFQIKVEKFEGFQQKPSKKVTKGKEEEFSSKERRNPGQRKNDLLAKQLFLAVYGPNYYPLLIINTFVGEMQVLKTDALV